MAIEQISNYTPYPWHFDFRVVDSEPDNLLSCYRLRYEIFCLEQHFLPPEPYPNQLEQDSYDDVSTHIGAFNKEGVFIGTVRLVKPSPLGFPIFQHCEFFKEYEHLKDPDNPMLNTTAEISRLIVSKQYRRRLDDGLYGLAGIEDPPVDPAGNDQEQPKRRRRRPEIVMGLYKCMYQESKRLGVTHWFAAMDQRLMRVLNNYSFSFKPIGPEIDYYGPVTPYFASLAEIEDEVMRNRPELVMEFTEGLPLELLVRKQENAIT